MNRRRFLTLCAALPLFSGCSEPRHHHPLRVGSNLWLGCETLFLARTQGHLEEDRGQLIEMPNASDVLRAIRSGALEAACLTLDEFLTLLEDGLPMRVVLVMDASNGADPVMARPEIIHPAQLKGRRVAAENTAVGGMMLQAVLEEGELTAADIEPVPLTPERQEAAYRNGEVDAVVTFEPFASPSQTLGARRLFDSSRRPGMILDLPADHPPRLTETMLRLEASMRAQGVLHRPLKPGVGDRPRLSAGVAAMPSPIVVHPLGRLFLIAMLLVGPLFLLNQWYEHRTHHLGFVEREHLEGLRQRLYHMQRILKSHLQEGSGLEAAARELAALATDPDLRFIAVVDDGGRTLLPPAARLPAERRRRRSTAVIGGG